MVLPKSLWDRQLILESTVDYKANHQLQHIIALGYKRSTESRHNIGKLNRIYQLLAQMQPSVNRIFLSIYTLSKKISKGRNEITTMNKAYFNHGKMGSCVVNVTVLQSCYH